MSSEAQPPGQSGEEGLDEMPTLPPAPAARPDRLRWATREPPPPPHQRAVRRAPPPPANTTVPVTRQVRATLPAPPLSRPREAGGGPSSSTAAAPRLQRGRHRAARWLLALAVVVVLAGAAVYVAFGRPAERASGVLVPARDFESLLQQLASADALANRAAGAACAQRAPGLAQRERALSSLRTSEEAGQGVLSRLSAERAQLLAWPPGRALYGELASVTRLFLEKGADLELWVAGLQATGCYSAPTNNLFHARAVKASSAEQAAARPLLAAWALPARRYHLASFASI